MHVAVYLPLLLPLLSPLGARALSRRCEPRLATWLLTGSAVVLSAASTLSLVLLAITGLIRFPVVAALGHWSAYEAQHHDPASLSAGLIAGLVVGGTTLAALRLLWRRARTLAVAATEAACLPARGDLVVLDDEVPEAFAVPGLPGRVVVSTGMLRSLDEAEHHILLAHERAHLAGHHYLFVALAQFGAAANPFLRPLATAVTYTVERWADEKAAACTGDRDRVARAVGKAALAAHDAPARTRAPLAALGILGRRPRLAAAGPVPRRVAALLAPPLRRHPALAAATAAVLTAATLSTAEAAHDLHLLLESVGAW